MNLIALVGFIGSGKDTVGRHLVEEHGFRDMAFADALKDTCAAMFCWDRVMLDGKNPQSREWRNQVDPWWAAKLSIPHFTPRWALQNIGTEILRRHFNDNLWIHNVNRRIERIREEDPQARIVLTDGRFPNELDMVRNLGGTIARVRRGAEPDWYATALRANVPVDLRHGATYEQRQRAIEAAGLKGVEEWTVRDRLYAARMEMEDRAIHVSEWAWIGYDMDVVIENDTTLDALFARANALVK